MITQTKKRKMNPMLLNVLLISGGLHLVAIFVLGGITIVKYIIPDDTQFEEPPAVVEEVPPPDVKVEIKQQPAPQQNSMQNLQMKQVGNITVDAVDVALPSMGDSFTVSAGLGNLGAGGGLLGGTRGTMGMGMSDVSVFGLKTRAERILFVIDANRHMVTDEKGGLNSYQIIKDEITDMIGNLSAGTLFNVIIADRHRTMNFKNQLVPAGEEIHKQLVDWIAPINKDARTPGLEGVSSAQKPALITLTEEPTNTDMVWGGGQRGNETAFLTQVALEQNVDAVFMIAGYHRGFERLRRQLTEREEEEWMKEVNSDSYQKQLEKHEAEKVEMRQRVANSLAATNKRRAERGQPPRVLDRRNGIYSGARELGLEWETPHPGPRPVHWRDPREVQKYFRELVQVLYENKGAKKPSVNVILFLAGDEEMRKEWKKQLDDYTRLFKGKNRVIRGLNEIKGARSSANTRN